MKEEKQQTLFNRKINNKPPICNGPNLDHLPRTKIRVLGEFYTDFTSTGLCLFELERKLHLVMSKNSVISALQWLSDFSLISLVARNVGKTKRRKYYKITESGVLTWERINKRN